MRRTSHPRRCYRTATAAALSKLPHGDAMANHSFLILLAAISICFVGCLEPDGNSSSRPDQDAADELGAGSQQLRAFPESRVLEPLSLNDCLATTTWVDLPRDAFNVAQTHWDGEGPLTTVYYHGFRCDRIGFGVNESIGSAFILESTAITGHPEACAPRLEPGVVFLHAIYADDIVLGHQLADALGAPFYEAEISLVLGEFLAPELSHVRWTAKSFTESTISSVPPPLFLATAPSDYVITYLFADDTQSSRMVLAGSGLVHDANANQGPFAAQEPTILANAPLDTIPVTTVHEENAMRTGVITQWNGPECASS